MFDNKSRHHGFGLPPFHRRLLCETLEARTLLSVSLAAAPAAAAQQQTLADLPVAAQQAISSAIGQDQSAYHAASAAAGVTLANPANGFTAQVQSGALQVSAGSDTWDMSLAGLGYGGAVQPVGTAQTSVNGNRVDCNYGTIDEWYVNGPGGLEQGFTVAPPPQSEASGSLTVELALGGDLTGTVNAAGDGLTLTRPDGSAALGYTGLTAYDATGKTLPASLEVQTDGRPSGTVDPRQRCRGPGPDHHRSVRAGGQAHRVRWRGGRRFRQLGFDQRQHGGGRSARATVDGNAPGCGLRVHGVRLRLGRQTAKLTASDGAASDDFGDSVSISGNTVVVGAPTPRSAATASRGRPMCSRSPAPVGRT